MPTDPATVLSSHVKPSRSMTAIWPPSNPPPGVAATVVMPFARSTGIASLSLWNATCARSAGLKSSSSSASPNPPAPGSTRPVGVEASMNPG